MRVALKYCGGCDPGYDRVEYCDRIRAVASNTVEWVSIEDQPFDAVLLICGCHTGCPEKDLPSVPCQVFSVFDNHCEPSEIASALCQGERNENQN